MSVRSFESELLEAILSRIGEDKLITKILQEEISVAIELIKLGYSYSIYSSKNMQPVGTDFGQYRNVLWIHVLAYCDDKKAEELVEELFVSELKHKGDCLITMWVKNQKKALNWLKLINEFDPQFSRFKLRDSPLTKKLCEHYSCAKADLFTNLLLKEHKAKKEIIESTLDKALYTWKHYFEITEDMKHNDKVEEEKKVRASFKEREKLIKSGTLSPEQADRLFEVLWEGLIEFHDPPENLFERNPTKVFICDEGRDYKFYQEVLQFFDLLPLISEKSDKKLIQLMDYLPYWLEHYSVLEKKFYKLAPEQVLKDWKTILQSDLECGKPKSVSHHDFRWLKFDNKSRTVDAREGGSGRPSIGISGKAWYTRPIIEEILTGLERLEQLKDKEFLLNMTNHYDEDVRKEAQRQLRDLI